MLLRNYPQTLNRAIFPVKYNDKFYSEVQKSGEHTQLAYYSTDILVGAICCRVEEVCSLAEPKCVLVHLFCLC